MIEINSLPVITGLHTDLAEERAQLKAKLFWLPEKKIAGIITKFKETYHWKMPATN